jgi:hypothetical protein
MTRLTRLVLRLSVTARYWWLVYQAARAHAPVLQELLDQAHEEHGEPQPEPAASPLVLLDRTQPTPVRLELEDTPENRWALSQYVYAQRESGRG